MKKTICLDFDGVIHSYISGWQGPENIPDLPTGGARVAIQELRNKYRVVVYSTRCKTEEGKRAIDKWLAVNGIEVDGIVSSKPMALVYLDDRGLKFTGSWSKAVGDINNFETWQGKR